MALKNSNTFNEIRTEGDAGIVEGYIAVWDTIDSYNSRFERGAFKRTIKNRLHKIRMLWNHDQTQPIGKLIEIREDDHGVFIKAQLIMEVEKAKETFELIRGGAIDCFSFGFRTIKEHFENGVEVIEEVMLGEISPVVFEANGNSVVTSLRSDDFKETQNEQYLKSEGYRLFSALDYTIDDIWWGNSGVDEKIGLIDKAISDFHLAYAQWTKDVIESKKQENVRRDGNSLQLAFRNFLNDKSFEELAQNTNLSIDELRSLSKGVLIPDHERLKSLDTVIYDAHQKIKAETLENVCNQLRAGINPAEATRIHALLNKSITSDNIDLADNMKNFRNNLIGE